MKETGNTMEALPPDASTKVKAADITHHYHQVDPLRSAHHQREDNIATNINMRKAIYRWQRAADSSKVTGRANTKDTAEGRQDIEGEEVEEGEGEEGEAEGNMLEAEGDG